MKATGAGPLLAVAIVVGLLTACIAISANDDRAKVRTHQAHQKQVLEGHEGSQLYKVTLELPLHMGRSYGRPEDTQAREKLERLLRDYGDRNAAATKAPLKLAALGQPAGPSYGSTMVVALVSEHSVRVLKTLPWTENVSRLTVLEGMPYWIWCRLFRRACLS